MLKWHGWDHLTLSSGISQFLRDIALEWYYQSRISYRCPQIWNEFVDLFLSQFDSSVRSAHQEQEWYECKQQRRNLSDFSRSAPAPVPVWISQTGPDWLVDRYKPLATFLILYGSYFSLNHCTYHSRLVFLTKNNSKICLSLHMEEHAK